MASTTQPSVYIVLITYFKDAPRLMPFLRCLAAQTHKNWTLHIIDTTRTGYPDAPSYLPRLRQAVDIALPGKKVEIIEYEPRHKETVVCERIANARNMLREKFLKTDARFFLALDGDIMLPPHAIERLVSRNAPVVSGLYMTHLRLRSDEHPDGVPSAAPVAFVQDPALPPGNLRPLRIEGVLKPMLMPVFAVGFGCLLSRRDVVERVPIHHVPEGGTEDFSYCLALHQQGIPVLLDTSVKCIHLKYPQGDPRNNELDFRDYPHTPAGTSSTPANTATTKTAVPAASKKRLVKKEQSVKKVRSEKKVLSSGSQQQLVGVTGIGATKNVKRKIKVKIEEKK